MFTKAIAAALVALPFLAQSVVADCTRTHVVQQGEICDSISVAKNVSTYQLAVVNPTIDAQCGNLLPGQTLCLGSSPSEDCSTTYVVKAGNTCEGIASGAGVNTTILFLNNPQINNDCSNIYVGEVLCTAKTVQVPPAPANAPPPAATIPTTAQPANPTAQAPAPASPAPASPAPASPAPASPAPASPAPAAPAPAAPAPAAPAPADPAPAAPAPADHSPAPSASNQSSDDDNECDGCNGDNDNDDDDLPFCDEI